MDEMRAKLQRSVVIGLVFGCVCGCVRGSVTTITRNYVHRSSPNTPVLCLNC